ncbi:MAG: CvpA family protein [Synergistaceae bacterium]|nr:CvpA family protein [Synergistaceae bacterium]
MSVAQLFDIAAALVIVALGIIGLLSGFISAVMYFVSLFCGTYFAWVFSEEGAALFLKHFPNVDESIARIAAMAILFFCAAAVITLISKLLCSLISFTRLSSINHMAGMLIGFATGGAIVIAVYGGITHLAPEIGQGWIDVSIFMNLAKEVWPYVYNFLVSKGIFEAAQLVPQIV